MEPDFLRNLDFKGLRLIKPKMQVDVMFVLTPIPYQVRPSKRPSPDTDGRCNLVCDTEFSFETLCDYFVGIICKNEWNDEQRYLFNFRNMVIILIRIDIDLHTDQGIEFSNSLRERQIFC